MGLAGLASGWVWRSLGRLLGVTWPAFERSWAALGPSWALPGRLLRTSWAVLVAPSASQHRSGSRQTLQDRFCHDFCALFHRCSIDFPSFSGFSGMRLARICFRRWHNFGVTKKAARSTASVWAVRRVVASGCVRGFRRLFVRACFGANMQAHLVHINTYFFLLSKRIIRSYLTGTVQSSSTK